MMSRRLSKWFWLLALGAVLAGVCGCQTNEPENASARPWDAPQGYDNGLGALDTQQHE